MKRHAVLNEIAMKMKHLLRSAAVPLGLLTGVDSTLAQEWIQTSAPMTNWQAAASSADGTKLVAVAGGPIYISSNSGTTWTQSSAPDRNWLSVASSADGSKLAAVADRDGIYLSTNGGATWDLSSAPTTSDSVACSADGTRWVAGPALHISTDAGVTWTPGSASGGAWSPVASSADGNTVVGLHFYGEISVSTNAGATSTTTNPNNGYWTSAALSAGGRRIVVACIRRRFQSLFLPGEILTSTNAGATWTLTTAPGNPWSSVASSADGTKLVAACGSIYTSTNAGATWTSNNVPTANWSSVASSADGGKLVAVINGGGIWTLESTPVPALHIVPAGTNLVLSWTMPSTPFVLQENSDLTPANWTDVPATLTLNFANLHNQVTLPLPTGDRFYRLRH